MDVKISNNVTEYKSYYIEPYINLIGNTILIYWQITDSFNKLVKNDIPSLSKAIFFIDNFLENGKK